jgi:hypothetical protein
MNGSPDIGNRRILVIDDTPSIHQDFRKILGSNPDSEAALDSSEVVLFGDTPIAHQAFELDSAYQGQEDLAKVCESLKANRPCARHYRRLCRYHHPIVGAG